MKIYLLSDCHFQHSLMLKLCKRPEGFEQKILRSIALTVKPEDILINLGDFCWHQDAFWHEQYMVFAHCKNWLVIGNHDGKNASWYMTHGWDWAGDSCTVELFGEKILFSHKPLIDTGYTWNIHGHFHDNPIPSWEPELVSILSDKHILISMEASHCRPVELQWTINTHKNKISKEKEI